MTHIQVVSGYKELIDRLMGYDVVTMYLKRVFSGLMLWQAPQVKCAAFLRDEKIQELLHSQKTFDLVISEATRVEESMLVFGHVFNAPTISLWSTGPLPVLNSLTGNSISIAYAPDYTTFTFTSKMTFLERVKNLWATLLSLTFYHLFHLPRQEEFVKKYLPDLDIPPLEVLARNVSLTLINSHPTISYPQPYTPNMIPIAGAHIRQRNATLPQDISQFMDNALGGVVYFSLGTLMPLQTLPEHLIKTFISVFEKLPYKVLVKASPEEMPQIPSNVFPAKWIPQQAVLAHPNCRLFVTHGGLFSQWEALDAGVPVVALPFIGDQFFNARFYEELQVGVRIPLESVTNHSLAAAILEVMENQRYTDEARRVSKLFRSVPIPPMESAIYWIEYVLKHRGAFHLTPASASLNLHQRALLDIMLVFSITAIIAIVFIYIMCKKCVLLFRKKLPRIENNSVNGLVSSKNNKDKDI
ncbi:UDP-glycosyltransferase UGT5-like [Homalodisca vitripennis]|uniref:UDP-glycosyltransferase UGT5-like n=1 Tax=Homalodisca vitripennis TaxID=197043 RepID=UPI001EEB0B1F|nr:UDP-glycosyltransferase UGT5-like [Homalodisca vitripennis]